MLIRRRSEVIKSLTIETRNPRQPFCVAKTPNGARKSRDRFRSLQVAWQRDWNDECVSSSAAFAWSWMFASLALQLRLKTGTQTAVYMTINTHMQLSSLFETTTTTTTIVRQDDDDDEDPWVSVHVDPLHHARRLGLDPTSSAEGNCPCFYCLFFFFRLLSTLYSLRGTSHFSYQLSGQGIL